LPIIIKDKLKRMRISKVMTIIGVALITGS